MSLESLHSGGSPFGRFFRSLRTTRQFSTASCQPCGSPFLYWSVIRFATTDFLVVVRFIFGSLASCAPLRFLCGGAFFCSWVLRSLVRIGEREERERGRGVSAFLARWLVLLFLGSGVGFGAFFPSTLPLLFFPFLPVGLRPWLRCSLHGLMWGFRVPRLLGCWSRQVVLSPFLAFCFFPFVTSNYTIVLWYFTSFF